MMAAAIIYIIVMALVYNDAAKLKQRGAQITPIFWTAFIFFAIILALPAYLILRYTTWTKQVEAASANQPPEQI